MTKSKVLGQDIAIFKANHVLDVFFGKDGWANHARFIVKRGPRGKFATQVAGHGVPSSVFKRIIEEVIA